MNRYMLLVCSAVVGTFLWFGMFQGEEIGNQDFRTDAVVMAPELYVDLPVRTQGMLSWADGGVEGVELSEHIRTESKEWIDRLLYDTVVPYPLNIHGVEILVPTQKPGLPVVYQGSRAKFKVPGGALFVTQSKGFITFVFQPNTPIEAHSHNTDEGRHEYLVGNVQKLFRHTPAMLHLSVGTTLTGGYGLNPDWGIIHGDRNAVEEEIHRIDSELDYPAQGGILSYYWGAYFFGTDGSNVVVTFRKLLGGTQINVDSPVW